MPPSRGVRDIVSSRTTSKGDAVTVERTPRFPVWITAWDGEDEVALGLDVKDVQWLMAALQVAIDGPSATRPAVKGPPRLQVLEGGPDGDGVPIPRRGPIGLIGRPRAIE